MEKFSTTLELEGYLTTTSEGVVIEGPRESRSLNEEFGKIFSELPNDIYVVVKLEIKETLKDGYYLTPIDESGELMEKRRLYISTNVSALGYYYKKFGNKMGYELKDGEEWERIDPKEYLPKPDATQT